MISNIIDRRKTRNISNLMYEEGISSTTAILSFTTDIADHVFQEKEILSDAYQDLWEQTKHRQGLYLHELHLNPDKYNKILSNAAEIPLGITEFNGEASSIIINSHYESLQSIEDIILFSNEFGTYTLSDIAEISLENTNNKKTYEFN